MKKNYVKPSLLSEIFVSENIMEQGTGEKEVLSTPIDLYLNGVMFEGITFVDDQALNSIKVSDFAN